MYRSEQDTTSSRASGILWRRLDTPGHDASWLERSSRGWRLHGVAVFLSQEVPVALDYLVECDGDWVSRRGSVRGQFGDSAVSIAIERDASGSWTLDGEVVEAVSGCLDLDLGFTPATNTLALRRLALPPGETAEVTSAWLDLEHGTLEPLLQRYERRRRDAYWYEAPRFAYAEQLIVAPSGSVLQYPGLWAAECQPADRTAAPRR